MSTYFKLFRTFAKVGAFTIGGGLAMLPLIRDEIVNKNKWIDDDEFMDMVAISQSLPGLIAVNIAIFIGNKLKGTKGSIVATLGSVLPSFLIILLIAMIFSNFKDNPVVIAVFKGIRPAVVALIAVPTVQLAIRSKLNWWRLLLAVVTMALIAFLKVSPIYILLTVAVITAFIAYYQEKRSVR